MTTKLYDPLFSGRKTEKAHVETAAPLSPVSNKPMISATAGGFDQPGIPVWIDPESRICLPVLK